ncbi:MAG: amidase [Acidimicrobiales bacterium]|jgi:amidase
MDSELTWSDASEQADLVRSGQVSPLELVEAAIERIERIDPALNAVIHRRFAAASDEAAGELPDGPFRGVPIVLKDLGAPQAGEPYCEGTAFAKAAGHRAGTDSYLVQRFKRAGFVILGRTNTPELGTAITTEPLAFGPTRNPWDTEHSTGGSSGGSAAAVASGMVPVAHGNDGGGSIRIPASCCGLFGLKPSRGRVSKGPEAGESWYGLSVDHVLARSVRDSAAILDQIAGYHPGDTFVVPAPVGPFARDVGADPGRLRIGLLDRATGSDYTLDPECAEAVRSAGRLLDSLGHRVEMAHPASLEEPDFDRHCLVVIATAVASELAYWSTALGREVSAEEYEPLNAFFATMSRSIPAPDYLESLLWLEDFRRRTVAFWSEQGFDLLLTPVLAQPTARLGELAGLEGYPKVVETLRFTAQFNVSGQPAASLPLYWAQDGLPVGVQLVADYGREDVLIRVASQLEQARPWAERHPPVHA